MPKLLSKEAVFTMKLEPKLRSEFMELAASEDRPASQIMRELMRNYIEQRRQLREYQDYLSAKVDRGRASILEGRGLPNNEVEAAMAAHRSLSNN